MKTVGIVTTNTSFANNYGAVLQCYAMVEQLKKWNLEPHVINYTYFNKGNFVQNIGGIDRTPCARLRYLMSSDSSLYQKMQYRLKRKKREEMEKKFVAFYQNYLPMHSEHQVTYEELCEHPLDYDAYITGSDQVWNPVVHGNTNDPICFLQFAQLGAKRIAYAPSFGINDYPEELYTTLNKYLKSFDTISVRERTGQQIIKKACGIDGTLVLDPTLMADPGVYRKISAPISGIPSKYILCYRFGDLPYANKIICNIAQILNLPVIELPLSMAAYGKGTKLCYDVDPSFFIGVIQNAELILTDSFHCTVFSILNRRPFYTFLRQKINAPNNMNARMVELLDMLKLGERLIWPGKPFAYERIFEDILNYDEVEFILNEKRKQSQQYLKDALGV